MQIKQNGLWVNPPANIQWRLNNQWHRISDSSIYKLATDDDFIGDTNGGFEYVGTEEYIEIPHIIKGVDITSYRNMFEGSSTIKGVKSTNANVTTALNMFHSVQSDELDLSELDLSSVTSTIGMFGFARVGILDLSKWDTSTVTNKGSMFFNATIETIYARTQADVGFFIFGASLPTSTNVIVK